MGTYDFVGFENNPKKIEFDLKGGENNKMKVDQGKVILEFGKYKGKTVDWVLKNDLPWVTYMLEVNAFLPERNEYILSKYMLVDILEGGENKKSWPKIGKKRVTA